jgi:hypothetical protein
MVQDIIGTIKYVFLEPDDVPERWYIPNGDTFPVDSPQGKVLIYHFSAAIQEALGIVVINDRVNLPNVFMTNGEGYFLRPANGFDREIGSIQGDAMRNIKSGDKGVYNMTWLTGSSYGPLEPFVRRDAGVAERTFAVANWPGITQNIMDFDASTADGVVVADENRPHNIGVLPIMYLGV